LLAKTKTEVTEQDDARKKKIDPAEAVKLARAASEIWAAKGKKVVHFRMNENPTDNELIKQMVGPSGNLRAPTLKKGKKLFVGFHEDLAEFLG
jgi:hypothetical protein